jgi:hypothetical protein
MARIYSKIPGSNKTNVLTIKENIYITRSKKDKKILLSSICLNILLIISLILTTIK